MRRMSTAEQNPAMHRRPRFANTGERGWRSRPSHSLSCCRRDNHAIPQAGGKAPRQWTPAARLVLEKAPNRVQVLAEFLRRFRPRIWSGSRAAIIESNARMLDELDFGGDAAAISFVEQAKKKQEPP